MRYCKNCKLNFQTPLSRCLFCNNELLIKENLKEEFHFQEVKKEKHVLRTLARILIFLLIFGNSVCLYIDYITAADGKQMSWSYIVLSVSVYVILILFALTRNTPVPIHIIWFCLSTLAELLVIGLVIENYHWALDYLIPFGLIGIELFATSLLLGGKKKLYDASIYVFILSLLGLVPAVIEKMGFVETSWPSVTSGFYSGVTLFGLFFFGRKTFLEELKRRFYI